MLVHSDREAHLKFSACFEHNQFLVFNFNTAMGAILHIKESKPVDLLIIDEFIKPMGAAQTLNYLHDELHFKSPVLVCSESKAKFETDSGIYETLQKPFDHTQYLKVKKFLGEPLEDSANRYSLNYLTELADGDQTFIAKSIGIFLETVSVRIHEMQQLLVSNDYDALAEMAHNIKPSFEMIENKRGSELCNFLAHHAQPGDFKSAVAHLTEEYNRVEIQLLKKFKP